MNESIYRIFGFIFPPNFLLSETASHLEFQHSLPTDWKDDNVWLFFFTSALKRWLAQTQSWVSSHNNACCESNENILQSENQMWHVADNLISSIKPWRFGKYEINCSSEEVHKLARWESFNSNSKGCNSLRFLTILPMNSFRILTLVLLHLTVIEDFCK